MKPCIHDNDQGFLQCRDPSSSQDVSEKLRNNCQGLLAKSWSWAPRETRRQDWSSVITSHLDFDWGPRELTVVEIDKDVKQK
jgi:hypothetical protein